MELTQTLFNDIRRHCTSELLSYIRNIHISNDAENQWDITELIDTDDHLYEILKIIYAFEKLGGSLIYKKEIEIFPVIIRNLNNPMFLGIPLFWENNEINGDVPIFNIGELEIPKILPLFSSRPTEDGKFIVERLTKGKYEIMPNEVYLTEIDACKRAEQLNHEN